jgi:hypothetical protein
MKRFGIFKGPLAERYTKELEAEAKKPPSTPKPKPPKVTKPR